MAIFNIYYVQSFTFVRNFMRISQTVFNLQGGHEYMVEMVMFNVQRAVTPNVGKPESRFMCSASRLIVLYICLKFRETKKTDTST